MTVLRSGATQKYSKNWTSAFGEKKADSSKVAANTKTGKAASSKKANVKPAVAKQVAAGKVTKKKKSKK